MVQIECRWVECSRRWRLQQTTSDGRLLTDGTAGRAAVVCWIGMRGCCAVHAARLKQLKIRRFLCHKAGHCVACCRVFICQQSYLLSFGIPSPTHSFIPGLKPPFSANPSHCSPSFLLLKYLLRGFPGLFTVISEHICFLLLVFFLLFLHF